MTWQILWTAPSERDLARLDRRDQIRIVDAVTRYATTERGDVLALAGAKPPELRLRVGAWRVRFRRDAAQGTLFILRVLPRDKAYR